MSGSGPTNTWTTYPSRDLRAEVIISRRVHRTPPKHWLPSTESC